MAQSAGRCRYLSGTSRQDAALGSASRWLVGKRSGGLPAGSRGHGTARAKWSAEWVSR